MEMTQVNHYQPEVNMDKVRPILMDKFLALLNYPPHEYSHA